MAKVRYDVKNGETSTNLTLNKFDSMFVYSGGTATGTLLKWGGSLSVRDGFAENTVVNSVGNITVNSGGTAKNTTVNSGG